MPRLSKFAAIHEAAHAVAIIANRRLLNARIKYVSIVPGDRMVRTRQALQYRVDEPRQIRAFIEVALAGIAANVAFSRMGRSAAMLGTGLTDWPLASDAAKWIDGSDLDDLLEDAIGFVKRERVAVHALAEALMPAGHVSGEEAERIIVASLTTSASA